MARSKSVCAAALLLALTLTGPLRGAWRSELYPENWTPPESVVFGRDKFLQDFSYAGYGRGERPIPEVRTERIYNVVEFGADPLGQKDSTAAIQLALDRAASDPDGSWRVVWLPRGTYRLSVAEGEKAALYLRANRIVLRGEGRGRSILLNTTTRMRSKVILQVAPMENRSWRTIGSRVTDVVADLDGPSVEIPVRDASAFQPGDQVIVRSEINADWLRDHPDPNWLVIRGGFAPNGGKPPAPRRRGLR